MPKLTVRLFLFFSVVATLMIPGCVKKNPQKVTLGYVSTGLTGLAVKVMIDNKIPEKHGIEFEYQGFPNPSSLNAAFVLGKNDVNMAAGANVIAMYVEQGQKLVYFYPSLINSVSLIVRAESSYSRLQDLKNKNIGWYGEASGGGTAFYIVGLKEGVNVKDEFKLVESSPSALWPLLDRGEVEGIIIYEPFVSKMLATKKYRSILGPFWQEWKKHTGFELEMAGFACSKDWYDNNQDKVNKIISVWKETATYIKAHVGDVIRKYPELTDLTDPTEIQLAENSIPAIYAVEWGSLDVSIETMLKLLAEQGVLIKNYPKDMLKKADSR